MELGGRNVRVNSISPGAIVTGIHGKACGVPDDIADRTAGVLEEDFANAQPMPRAGTPEDIAQAAACRCARFTQATGGFPDAPGFHGTMRG